MVFSKVGTSLEFAIASISILASSMACKNAGLKCSFFILENGAVSNGVNNGFI
jgi:hypothetical protein